MDEKQKIIAKISSFLPKEADLPANFNLLFELPLPTIIGWSYIENFELKPSAKNEMVPFLKFGDGGVLAFWFIKSDCAIVYLGSEGELEVISEKFDSFLYLLNTKCTGLSEFDDSEEKYDLSSHNIQFNSERKDYLNKELLIWYKKHTTLLEPKVSTETEKIRRNVMKIAHAILDDGLSKVYTKESIWWDLSFKIKIDSENLNITYRDYGKWYVLPEKYNLEKEVRKLLLFVKNKSKKEYDLSISSPGIVSINRDTELVLTETENT